MINTDEIIKYIIYATTCGMGTGLILNLISYIVHLTMQMFKDIKK